MLIGVSLGTLGSGGSILTVPIMVYLMNISPVTATGYSLFVVGLTSLVGWVNYTRKGLVHLKTALIFALPSLLSVFLTRKYLMPLIPDVIFSSGNFTLHKNLFIMLLFAVLMVVVAYKMIKTDNLKKEEEKIETQHYSLVMLIGFFTGILTGIVGIGGGFLIIPALVFFARIPIKMSVGTSLMIIAANSFIGFAGELATGTFIDWRFLFTFSAFSVFGIVIGIKISSHVPSSKLKPAFGWFVLAMGVAILLRELL